ncbi:MAG: type IX secretion system sortase PorU [Bacteroidota bacterium]
MNRIVSSLCLALTLSIGTLANLSAQRVATPTATPKTFFDGNQGRFVPEWTAAQYVSARSAVNDLLEAPAFFGANYDHQVTNLPFHVVEVQLRDNESVQLQDVGGDGITEESSTLFARTMKESGLRPESGWYPEAHAVLGPEFIKRGVRYQQVYLYPIQVNVSGNRIRKATAVNYRIARVPNGNRRGATNARQGYNPESVLAAGVWHKLGVTEEGIYRLDYDYLSSLGIPVNSVDPRTIRVHGNGGGMLPQIAGEYPYDDLEENAIFVSGQGDGSFDPGDFVLFYGQSPHVWKWVDRMGRYAHFQNFYSDTTFYFLTYNQGAGKRVATATSPGGVTASPTTTTSFQFHERELLNRIISGRIWLGETFDLTTNQTFSFPAQRLAPNENILATVRTVARSNGTISNFTVREGNNILGTLTMPATNNVYGSYEVRGDYDTFTFSTNAIGDGSIDINLNYDHPLTSSVGYLDFIEVQYKERLDMAGASSFFFTATDGVAPGQVFNYQIGGGSSSHMIWDITDPLEARAMSVTSSGSTMGFTVNADSMKRFVAFSSGAYRNPVSARRIQNQNLHALPQADYLIFAPATLLEPANRLANFHRQQFNRSVHVVQPGAVYNEFSSGAPDPTALRDFIKMFYDRGLSNGSAVRYVLLFGDGSYDYKNIANDAASNAVISYQSRNSQLPTRSYISDDYFGFLDDGEGFWGEDAANETSEVVPQFLAEGDTSLFQHMLDVGVGRFPIVDAGEANAIVDKVIRYVTDQNGYGDWRSRVVLSADHKDSDRDIHMRQADSYTSLIEAANACANIDKIYMDNYAMVSTASGDKFPDGKDALVRAIDEGSLILNYTGHGGEVGWSNASILDISDINQLQNGLKMPACITATCEFGRWDDPARRSGGEQMFVKPDGGAIAMFTTVRVVYSGPNYTLNQNFYRNVFEYNTQEQRRPTMGEVFRDTKNASWGLSVNNRNFSLLGDPALPLNYPRLKAVVTDINGSAVVDTVVDTLASLNLITISGEVRDQQDNLLPNFNGTLQATVYDKLSYFITQRERTPFYWRKNRVFRGSATVNNGKFSFQFVVPIDVSYEDNLPTLNGKISLYFNDPFIDGEGCNTNILVWGSDSAAIVDDQGPMMDLFMNDEKFAEGGMVGPNPLLIADIFDENGLNMVGTGIGHELTAVLDGQEDKVIVLNDFYSANQDSYQEGRIEYPFRDLATGEHTLKVKVWDVANNSSESEIQFLVADDARMALGHVLNYPNPFTTNTKFYIEHNRNGALLDIQVRIYTVSGRLVKTLQDQVFADGNLYCDLEWDGLDEFGDVLGRGVYVYQVRVRDENADETITRTEKMVVLR